jgi:SAM-dependent methyltransferase
MDVAGMLATAMAGAGGIVQHEIPEITVREEVRDFYEKLPYPPPLESLDEHRALYSAPERQRALFHRMWPARAAQAHQEILVAGCGTSQAARYALREPGSRVTAVDISETSLRHTRELQHKYALHNLELHQLPLEDIGQLGRQFDQIVCTGVLHHLPDPDRGLRALRAVLAPGGAVQVMVYATYGRAGIYMLQEYCRMLGIGTSATDLQALGALLQVLPKDHPVAQLLGRSDFKRPDALADALLHPRDRAYTVPQLYAWLDRCGLSFGRWIEQAPYLPQCGILARTGHNERLAALPAAAQHAAAELFRGTMTQHRFIAYGNDGEARAPAIHFTGEHWREYVPLRLPWAVTIRERIPAGSVAVLLNPAHQLRDLLLPINAAQDGLLAQVDGRRTLGHLVAQSASPERSFEFFQQLWRYDQIVFDASAPRTCA